MNELSPFGESDRPIASRDARRLAEFFDRRIGAAYAFARAVWLPEAMRTLAGIGGAIEAANAHDVTFLCDHLREGARSVGAHAFIAGAGRIEQRFAAGEVDDAAQMVRFALDELTHVDAWLERRSRPRRSNRS